jgi:hypothetical protein
MGYNEFIGTFENAIELVDKLFLSNQSYSFVVMMSKLFKIWSTARVSAGTAYFYIFLYTYIHNLWLFVWNMNFMTYSIQLGISSSQLTNSIIFQRGRYTTNQNIYIYIPSIIHINHHCSWDNHLFPVRKTENISPWWKSPGGARCNHGPIRQRRRSGFHRTDRMETGCYPLGFIVM